MSMDKLFDGSGAHLLSESLKKAYARIAELETFTENRDVVIEYEKARANEAERKLAVAREVLKKYGKINHYYCEDSWYSCPKAEDGCFNDKRGPECDCGADERNAAIEEALAQIGGDE